MNLVIQFVLAKKEEEIPEWHPNKQNLTFDEMMNKLKGNDTWKNREEDFKPTMFHEDIPMLDKVKKEWLEDPQEYRKQLEQVRLEGETKLNKSYIPSGSNSSDPMLRLNGFIRIKCKFEEIQGTCRITKIEEDPKHKSLNIVNFVFDKDGDSKKYQMTHRYRNPYKYWVIDKDLRNDQELDCSKLIKKEGEICNDIEWDFKIDWK